MLKALYVQFCRERYRYGDGPPFNRVRESEFDDICFLHLRKYYGGKAILGATIATTQQELDHIRDVRSWFSAKMEMLLVDLEEKIGPKNELN